MYNFTKEKSIRSISENKIKESAFSESGKTEISAVLYDMKKIQFFFYNIVYYSIGWKRTKHSLKTQ